MDRVILVVGSNGLWIGYVSAYSIEPVAYETSSVLSNAVRWNSALAEEMAELFNESTTVGNQFVVIRVPAERL